MIDFDKNIRQISFLQQCTLGGIKLKPNKLTFCKTTIKLHGHTHFDTGIKQYPEEIWRIVDMPAPAGMRSVSHFNGMNNYLRKIPTRVNGTDGT